MTASQHHGASSYESLAEDFAAELAAHAVTLPLGAQLDALAGFLSSQLILFAGPSGTGKSTLARRLASFFSSRFEVLDGQPGLARRQELTGYASVLSGSPAFASTEDTEHLVALAQPPSGPGADDPPVLLVEEGNLSPIEGYLGPLVHGLSGLAIEHITWPLHDHGADLPRQGAGAGASIPRELTFKPWPRLLVTVNIDATAPAPAAKVAARGAVMLLEPPTLTAALESHAAVFGGSPPASYPGRGLAGDPRACLMVTQHAGEVDTLLSELQSSLASAVSTEGANLVSQRAAQRCLLYLAAYTLVAQGSPDDELRSSALKDGADNALLHHVLPSLEPAHFPTVAERARTAARPGGLLADRLARLRTSDEWSGIPDDFWSGLS
jgi:ABC-type cobalamin transport system ATPase subunit